MIILCSKTLFAFKAPALVAVIVCASYLSHDCARDSALSTAAAWFLDATLVFKFEAPAPAVVADCVSFLLGGCTSGFAPGAVAFAAWCCSATFVVGFGDLLPAMVVGLASFGFGACVACSATGVATWLVGGDIVSTVVFNARLTAFQKSFCCVWRVEECQGERCDVGLRYRDSQRAVLYLC
jgi:hypothetical protein